MIEKLEEEFTKYEIARILGARALQIAMDAPLLLRIDEKDLEEINFNPIEIAKRELVSGVLPITVKRPLPKKKETKIKKLTKEETEELKKKEEVIEKKEDKKEKVEEKEKVVEEKEVSKEEIVEDKEAKADDHEIMELSTPEDEMEEAESGSGEEEGV